MNDARRAFLLSILGGPGTFIHRDYVAEKVDFAFIAMEPWVLRQALDVSRQSIYDNILKETEG